VSDLHRWEMAWWEDLQALHMKVRYLMQMVEKPYLDTVPQFAHMQLEGRRDSFFTADSGEVGILMNGVVVIGPANIC